MYGCLCVCMCCLPKRPRGEGEFKAYGRVRFYMAASQPPLLASSGVRVSMRGPPFEAKVRARSFNDTEERHLAKRTGLCECAAKKTVVVMAVVGQEGGHIERLSNARARPYLSNKTCFFGSPSRTKSR